jgi:ubiquinone biosynthesis monooxygenase Coq7
MAIAETVSPLSVRSVLRVNHAGEYGAVRIYQAQRTVARLLAPDIVPFLDETLTHEKRHRDRFRALMRARGVSPCGAMPLWGVGGYVLGFVTGLLGRTAILTCTEAVERTVHHHLDDQLKALGTIDPEVSTTIREIQTEELGHLTFAENGLTRPTLIARLVRPVIAGSTLALIWLSTYGEALLVRRFLQSRPPSVKQT